MYFTHGRKQANHLIYRLLLLLLAPWVVGVTLLPCLLELRPTSCSYCLYSDGCDYVRTCAKHHNSCLPFFGMMMIFCDVDAVWND